MLMQQMRSTSPTAESANSRPVRERPVICARSGTSEARNSIFSGAWLARWACTVLSSARAWLNDTPGRRRAMQA
jgi:hypothetical protein